MSQPEKPAPITAKEILRRVLLPTVPLYAIAVLAVLALSHPNSAWTSALMSAAALLPLAMIVAGRYGGAARRPARYGFAICCGGYFLFFTLFADSPYVEVLATSKAMNVGYKHLFPKSSVSPMPSSTGTG